MKVIVLLISICLIGLVLYLGYRLDKKEEQNKRKNKYKEDELYGTKVEDEVTSVYLTKKAPKDENILQGLKFDSRKSENSDFLIQDETEDDESTWESLDEEFLVKKEEPIEEIIIPKEKVIKDETVVLDINDKLGKKVEKQETMIVNTVKKENILDEDINYEEDELLLDIEREIEQANIKKFTRKKSDNNTKIEQKKTKAKKDENKIQKSTSTAKKYTRKNQNKNDKKEKTKSSNSKKYVSKKETKEKKSTKRKK